MAAARALTSSRSRPSASAVARARTRGLLLAGRLGGGGGARLQVEVRAELGGQLGAALYRLCGGIGVQLAGAKLGRGLLQLVDQRVQATHLAAPLFSRTTAPRMPLMKPGASAPHSSFAASMASSIATSAGTSSLLRSSYNATRRMFRSSGAILSSVQPTEWRSISASSSACSSAVPNASSRVNSFEEQAELD